jgi:hypothetical protein
MAVCETEGVGPLDRKSLDTGTPTTVDGRVYPERLREFERFDDQLLPFIRPYHAATVNELLRSVQDPKLRAVMPRWLSSAEWRGLVERRKSEGPWAYVLGPKGRAVGSASRRAA